MYNIIGYGYVGSALGYLCKENKLQFTITDNVDKNEPEALRSFKNVKDTVQYAETNDDVNCYVICVPTPSGVDGKCDTKIVENVVQELSKACQKETYIIIKSTVCPGTCRELQGKYAKSNIEIVFCPEFLTERAYVEDMYNAKFIMLGFHEDASLIRMDKVMGMMQEIYKHNKDIKVISQFYEACEIFKYTINVFLGVKVWFFNEIYEICEKNNVEYNVVREMLQLDNRIGMSHTQVPGFHGFGFDGACLIKEMKSCHYLQKQLGIPSNVLEEILKRNSELREKKKEM